MPSHGSASIGSAEPEGSYGERLFARHAMVTARVLAAVSAPHRPSVRRAFPTMPLSAGIARQWIADLFAARQGSGMLARSATVEDGREVAQLLITVMRDAEVAATEGRGLRSVNALSRRWGVDLVDQGKVVWFGIGLADHPDEEIDEDALMAAFLGAEHADPAA